MWWTCKQAHHCVQWDCKMTEGLLHESITYPLCRSKMLCLLGNIKHVFFQAQWFSGALIAGLVPLEQPEVSAMLEGAVMIRENRDLNNTQFPWSHLVIQPTILCVSKPDPTIRVQSPRVYVLATLWGPNVPREDSKTWNHLWLYNILK